MKLAPAAVDVSLVLVAHESSAVAGAAMVSFRAEAGALGLSSEVIVVDHSESETERRALAALAPDQLVALPNRGYGAGLNTGTSLARGDVLLLANPDLVFERGSLRPLLDALAGGWRVVGPHFVAGELMLPPADPQTPRAELRRWLAARSAASWRRHVRREALRYRAAWRAVEPFAVEGLSGALLAVRRATALALRPFDESFFLYFEETDWLRQLAEGVALVPRARVRHAWGHGRRGEDLSPHFERSRRLYYGKHFGRLGDLVLRLPPRSPALAVETVSARAAPSAGSSLLWLVSPSLGGLPAAGAERADWTARQAAGEFFAAFPAVERALVFAFAGERAEPCEMLICRRADAPRP